MLGERKDIEIYILHPKKIFLFLQKLKTKYETRTTVEFIFLFLCYILHSLPVWKGSIGRNYRALQRVLPVIGSAGPAAVHLYVTAIAPDIRIRSASGLVANLE